MLPVFRPCNTHALNTVCGLHVLAIGWTPYLLRRYTLSTTSLCCFVCSNNINSHWLIRANIVQSLMFILIANSNIDNCQYHYIHQLYTKCRFAHRTVYSQLYNHRINGFEVCRNIRKSLMYSQTYIAVGKLVRGNYIHYFFVQAISSKSPLESISGPMNTRLQLPLRRGSLSRGSAKHDFPVNCLQTAPFFVQLSHNIPK